MATRKQAPGTFAWALLRWYDRERRDLPWRRKPTAYRTLVSELMLQQTVVATVIPYFQRFVQKFPDFAALARAPEQEVLAAWSGLGYYARARHLRSAAVAIVEHHGGKPPRDEATLRTLPGVGEYTAAAVASIAFGVRTFALDGNAARVMARLTADERPIDRPEVRKALRARGQPLVPAERAGDFAQAVMELGARVCVAKSPRCAECPVARFCEAHRKGLAAVLPIRSPRAAKRVVEIACVAVERAGRVLLVRRPSGTLLAGTWALPSADADRDDSDATACTRALLGLGLTPSRGVERLGVVRHVFTHRDMTARVLRATTRSRVFESVATRWVSDRDLDALPLSSFTRKTLALLDAARANEMDQGTTRISSPSTV